MNESIFNAVTIEALELLLGEMTYLEQHRRFSRYAISAEESTWICDDCGAAWVDPHDDGCTQCGNGNPDWHADDCEADEQDRLALDDA
jgi:rubrerythrin